jgi:DNA-directed RNA polymerase sigma subunit (sigma70/sigma32)
MTKKIATRAPTVTESTAQALLRRSGARPLAADEEKVLRMRLGASVPRKAELEWMGTESEELAIELRALEIETYLKLRAHQARRATAAAAPTASRTKEKIVRALRRKGPGR